MINTKRLRFLIGIMGMLLPLVVLVLSLMYYQVLPDSISATWYLDECVTPFMITLGAAGILLIGYTGYDRHDDIICTLAGFFALLICLFPCTIEDLNEHWLTVNYPEFVGTFRLPYKISAWIHNLSAVGFFGLLSYNSMFLFTKSSGIMTPEKEIRNKIYRICGIGMMASLVCIVPVVILEAFDIILWGAVWLIEMVALWFFGISWLTKADCIPFLFKDKK